MYSTGVFVTDIVPSDFIEIVAAEYRPGLLRFGIDDFSLSVSLPVITLANDIPARALMAWDPRLLSRTQNLTLLISGLRGTYPPLKADGTPTEDAVARGTSLQFKVGLTRKYKPSKEHALEVKRTYGLVDEEQQGPPIEEPPLNMDAEGYYLPEEFPSEEEEEDDDDGRFDSFSLSSSLESLLDHSLVRVIQMRFKYGLGWAGAETLLAEAERLQQTADDVLNTRRKVRACGCGCAQFIYLSQIFDNADKTERKLTKSYNLPPDPLVNRENMDELNLPLVAFCYLIRRLTVCFRKMQKLRL
jgi:ubiquitin-conjugating enzyme E2 Q